MLPKKSKVASLRVVYCTVFLDLLGFGLILPFLPYYARELGASGMGLGILFAAYSLAQLIASPLLGRLSDRFGRRPVLLLSLAGGALAMLLSGFADQLWTLCAARSLAGFAGGSIGTAQAYVADVSPQKERARYMGLVGAAIGLGFVFGPAFGVFLQWAFGLGFSGVAFVAGGLAAVNFCAALWLLEEPTGRVKGRPRASLGGLTRVLGRSDLWPVLLATFLLTFAFAGMETTLAYFCNDVFSFDETHFGLLLVYVMVLAVLVQGGLIGRLTSRFGVREVATAGGALMGVCLLLLPLGEQLWMLLLVLGGLAVAQGLTAPTLPTLVSLASAGDEQGVILGLRQSCGAAARALGPLVAGFLYDFKSASPYWLGGILALGASLLTMRMGLRVPEGKEAIDE